MENVWRSKKETLISELIQGMELAKQLREELSSISTTEDKELSLVEGILAAYEKALSALKWSGPAIHTAAVTANLPAIDTQTVAVTASLPTSPTSVDGSPHSDDLDTTFKDLNDLNNGSKKRKSLPRWTKQVRVSSETGLEGSSEDGYKCCHCQTYCVTETFAEAITDALFVVVKTVGQQSKCKDPMKIRPYLKSHIEENIIAPMETKQLHLRYHQKSKTRSK